MISLDGGLALTAAQNPIQQSVKAALNVAVTNTTPETVRSKQKAL